MTIAFFCFFFLKKSDMNYCCVICWKKQRKVLSYRIFSSYILTQNQKKIILISIRWLTRWTRWRILLAISTRRNPKLVIVCFPSSFRFNSIFLLRSELRARFLEIDKKIAHWPQTEPLLQVRLYTYGFLFSLFFFFFFFCLFSLHDRWNSNLPNSLVIDIDKSIIITLFEIESNNCNMI